MARKIILTIMALTLALAPATVFAKGGGGRGGVSSSRSSYSSRSSSSTRSSTPTKPSKPSSTSRSTSSSKIKPGSKVTVGDKSITTSTKKPSNGKYTSQAGITGVDGYTPRFSNGYSAPAGSVVYYPQHSALDYLPWIYLFSQNSPANDSATIVQPDGKEVVAKPEPEGADGLAVLNWFILILLGIGAIVLVMYLITKFTSGKPSYAY